MLFFENYKKALLDIKEYLQKDLAPLEIQAAQIYGSSTYKRGFIPPVNLPSFCVFESIYNKKIN